jgi:hypothetical protein
VRFHDNEFLQGWVVSPTPNPNLEDQVISLSLHLPRNLSGMCGPTISYAAAGIALQFTDSHKPLTPEQSAFDKVKISSRGFYVHYID